MSYHCHRCGTELASAPPVDCPACGYQMFLNARPTGTVVILDGDRFLAVVRAREPNAGRWDLPGGFCEGWELPADAAVREAREELNVTVRLDRFIGMYVGGYRFQDEVLPVLDMFWLASIVDGELRPDPSEATGHGWLPLHDPPPMAFSTMDSALREAAAMLAGRR
jgi:ADP-ribose pyrophosphatase YjhB (NUDIX family)